MAETEIIKELERINEYKISLYHLNEEELANILISYQRKRHLQFRQDGSSVSNNGHILTMANSVYDKAIYTTDEEYYIKYTKTKVYKLRLRNQNCIF